MHRLSDDGYHNGFSLHCLLPNRLLSLDPHLAYVTTSLIVHCSKTDLAVASDFIDLIKLAFHDTDIHAAILARIVERMSACRSACHRNNFNRACQTCRQVGVGVVECELICRRVCVCVCVCVCVRLSVRLRYWQMRLNDCARKL